MSDAIVKPDPPKSWVQSFVERARGEIKVAPAASPVSYVRETGTTLGAYTSGGILGSLLGAGHAKFGLDSKAGPVDGWVAGAGAIGSILLSGHFPELAAQARKTGGDAFTILTFRKAYEVVKHQPLAGGNASPGVQRIAAPGKGPGISGEDPIERVAKGLG